MTTGVRNGRSTNSGTCAVHRRKPHWGALRGTPSATNDMKQRSEVLGRLAALFSLLSLGCVNPKTPRAASVERSTLVGKWVVVEQTTTPLAIIPLCKPIRKGTTFTFTPTACEVSVDASGTPCYSYAYTASNHRISFKEADMLWLCTYELTPNSLTLISTTFFTPYRPEDAGASTRPFAANQTVTVTLTRK